MPRRIPTGLGRPAAGYPSTQWFNLPVTKDVALAPTPGTFDVAASAEYGRVHVSHDGDISAIHLHHEVDGTTGSVALEIYRRRSGVLLMIASATLAAGGGHSSFSSFTFVDDAYKAALRGDYLHMQATSKMGGSPVCFVDVHFAKTRL